MASQAPGETGLGQFDQAEKPLLKMGGGVKDILASKDNTNMGAGRISGVDAHGIQDTFQKPHLDEKKELQAQGNDYFDRDQDP